MSAVRLFSRAFFVSAKFTDISFEMKAILCFYFYAFGDVFRRNGIAPHNRIVNNHFKLGRTIPKNLKNLHHIVPVVRGGKYTKGNVVACCKECNNKKKYLTPVEMILMAEEAKNKTSAE